MSTKIRALLPQPKTRRNRSTRCRKENTGGGICCADCVLVMLSVFAGITAVKRAGVHTHPALSRVIENEAAPTCTEAGSCDEVIYCAECGEEVLRTHVTFGMPAHRFENEKCTVCGEEQRAKSE